MEKKLDSVSCQYSPASTLLEATMKLAALSFVSALSTVIAYSGTMTYYETGKCIDTVIPVLGCDAPTYHSLTLSLTHSPHPILSNPPTHPPLHPTRPRLLRLHLLRLRRRRCPLRPDDEQPARPKLQPPLRHRHLHLQSRHRRHHAGDDRGYVLWVCV